MDLLTSLVTGVVTGGRDRTPRRAARVAPGGARSGSPGGAPGGARDGAGRRPRPGAWLGAGPEAAAVLALFVVAAVGLFADTWSHPSRALIGVPADNVLTAWCLRWVSWALAHGHSIFFTHHIGAPSGVNLLTTTPVTLAGLALAPVTAGLGPVVAYNVLATGSVALSGWCAYLACRRYAAGVVGPVAGGLVYGFSPYMLAQSLGHAQLTAAFLPPLLVVLADEVVASQRRSALGAGALLGLLGVAQLLLSSELVVTEVVAGAVGLVVLALSRPAQVRSHLPHAAVALGAAAVVFAALAAWPLWVAFLGPGHLPAGGPVRGGGFVDDLANFVVPTRVQAVVPAGAARLAARFGAGLVESNAYLGLPLLAAAVATAVALWRRPVVRVMAGVGLVMAACSLGPSLQVAGHATGIPLPWRLVGGLPVLDDVLPSRLALYTDLAAAVLLAIGVGEAGSRWGGAGSRWGGAGSRSGGAGSRWGGAGSWSGEAGSRSDEARSRGRPGALALVAAALALIAVALFPRLPYPSEALAVPSFFTTAAVDRVPAGSTALVLPIDSASSLAWQAAADMRYRMPENHLGTGYRPPSPLGALAAVIARVQVSGQVPALAGTPSSAPAAAPRSGQSLTPAGPVTGGLPRPALAALAGDLRRACVRTVMVGPMPHRMAMEGLFAQILGSPPRSIGGVSVWAGLQGCRP